MDKTYTIDPTDKIIVFGGIPITGFAGGKHLTIKLDEEDFKTSSGNHGDTARIRNRKNTGEATLTLLQTSVTNTLLSAHRAVDLSTGKGVVPFAMKDINGSLLVTASASWIKKAPDINESDTVENREWVITLTGVRDTYFAGGNTPV